MRICLDARMFGLAHAGIGRYVANLIRELKTQNAKLKNIKITLLVRKKNLEEIKREFGDIFKIVLCEAPHYSFKEQILLSLQLIKLKPDLVHFPHFNIPILYPGKFIVTIHDLIKHTSKGSETTTRQPWFYWMKYLGYRFVFGQAVKRAIKILVPSQAVKEELEKRYGLPEEKIVVTYEGVDEKFQQTTNNKQQTTKILEKYKISKPFVIYTGSLYPHKNVERLVEAVKCFNDLYHDSRKLSLVVVCARSVFYERFKRKIEQMKAENCVKMIGFVLDEDLVLLYQEAEAFVFPSLSEGFGLPGLEAMACGCPVICSDIPVLREIYGEAAIYFDPFNPSVIAEKIKEVCSYDLNHRNKMIKRGLEQVKKYSWSKMAEQTLASYHSI